jgi:hypothetical protein
MPVFLKDLNSAFKSMRNLFFMASFRQQACHTLTIRLGPVACALRSVPKANGNLMMCACILRLNRLHGFAAHIAGETRTQKRSRIGSPIAHQWDRH